MTSMRFSTPARPTACAAEDAARVGRKQQLQGDAFGAGIVGGVVGGMGVGLLEGDAGPAERFLARPGHGQGQIEDADHGGSLRAAEVGVAAADHVGGDAALAIGRPGQRDQGRLAGDEIADLDGVADREDVPDRWCASGRRRGCRRSAPVPSPASRASRVSGRMPTATMTNRATIRSPLWVTTADRLLGPRLEGGHAVAQPQIDPLPAQFLMDGSDHLGIDRRHHLAGEFQERHVQACAG